MVEKQEKQEKQYIVAVGLDGSDSSWRALEEAVKQARSKNAILHIVSIQEHADASYSASEVLAAEKTSREKLESAQLKARMSAESEGVESKSAIVSGFFSSVMMEYVKQHHVDFLVVGDTGHSSIWGALLGTNVDKIVRHAPCSVLVVR